MLIVNYDCQKIIFNYLDIQSKIRLRQCCQYFYNNFHITNLNNLPKNLKTKLTCEILLNYSRLEILDVSFLFGITNISGLTNLKSLICMGICGIADNNIKNLVNLTYLDCRYNYKITNIDGLNNLEFVRFTRNNFTDEYLENLNFSVHKYFPLEFMAIKKKKLLMS